MRKAQWIVIPMVVLAGAAFAQSGTSSRMGSDRMGSDRMTQRAATDTGVVESTDPARVAEVERKAAEVMAAQEQRTNGSSGASAQGTTSSSHPMRRGKMHKDMSKEKPAGTMQRTPSAPAAGTAGSS